eukprot:TRINITY_DN33230_c0_g1_i1.p1 TRINITY_DN33230_c0_g1~~TRINITY_DN33230_c0_g1_i1.p1  ORF type:complete len:1023 (+),score=316.25 TRINITY_DN33230_c0_g1_i1:118-3186(+)
MTADAQAQEAGSADVTIYRAATGAVQTFTLRTGGVLRIGRGNANDIVMDFNGVSIYHAELYLRPAQAGEGEPGTQLLCLKDASKNGTGVRPGPHSVGADPKKPAQWEAVDSGKDSSKLRVIEHGWQLIVPHRSRKENCQLPESWRVLTVYMGTKVGPAGDAALDGEALEEPIVEKAKTPGKTRVVMPIGYRHRKAAEGDEDSEQRRKREKKERKLAKKDRREQEKREREEELARQAAEKERKRDKKAKKAAKRTVPRDEGSEEDAEEAAPPRGRAKKKGAAEEPEDRAVQARNRDAIEKVNYFAELDRQRREREDKEKEEQQLQQKKKEERSRLELELEAELAAPAPAAKRAASEAHRGAKDDDDSEAVAATPPAAAAGTPGAAAPEVQGPPLVTVSGEKSAAKGSYLRCGSHTGKPMYRRMADDKEPVFLYFWDGSGDASCAGWYAAGHPNKTDSDEYVDFWQGATELPVTSAGDAGGRMVLPEGPLEGESLETWKTLPAVVRKELRQGSGEASSQLPDPEVDEVAATLPAPGSIGSMGVLTPGLTPATAAGTPGLSKPGPTPPPVGHPDSPVPPTPDLTALAAAATPPPQPPTPGLPAQAPTPATAAAGTPGAVAAAKAAAESAANKPEAVEVMDVDKAAKAPASPSLPSRAASQSPGRTEATGGGVTTQAPEARTEIARTEGGVSDTEVATKPPTSVVGEGEGLTAEALAAHSKALPPIGGKQVDDGRSIVAGSAIAPSAVAPSVAPTVRTFRTHVTKGDEPATGPGGLTAAALAAHSAAVPPIAGAQDGKSVMTVAADAGAKSAAGKSLAAQSEVTFRTHMTTRSLLVGASMMRELMRSVSPISEPGVNVQRRRRASPSPGKKKKGKAELKAAKGQKKKKGERVLPSESVGPAHWRPSSPTPFSRAGDPSASHWQGVGPSATNTQYPSVSVELVKPGKKKRKAKALRAVEEVVPSPCSPRSLSHTADVPVPSPVAVRAKGKLKKRKDGEAGKRKEPKEKGKKKPRSRSRGRKPRNRSP